MEKNIAEEISEKVGNMELDCSNSDASSSPGVPEISIAVDPSFVHYFPGLRNPPDSGHRSDEGKKHQVVKSKSVRTPKSPDDGSTKSRYRRCDFPNYERHLCQRYCKAGSVMIGVIAPLPKRMRRDPHPWLFFFEEKRLW
ncbi:OLC1v1037264C1 [Oldenlandia corymbosa var. corymbosa]|uniref:OLC1v1037264C1 n=1 Tax=Oldenlandia corymbosa var. corymbosa TaxID=529605 RepID=A0AAV1CXY7_OLDCO|nr:OLC1v1037264C1 [Oldenlandia corymbosa var. corymbosa]